MLLSDAKDQEAVNILQQYQRAFSYQQGTVCTNFIVHAQAYIYI